MGKNFPTLLGVCSIWIFVVLIAGCGKKPEKLTVNSGPDASLEESHTGALAQKLSDIKYSQSKGGVVQWELKASAVQQELEGPTQLHKVEITYYGNDGKITVVTADSGAFETVTRNAQLRGNVLVRISDGTAVSADALDWDQGAGKLLGHGEVRISQDGSIIEGMGFELSPESESITVFEVRGVLRQQEKTS